MSTIYTTIKNNIGLREKEDGTMSGRFTALKKSDFSSDVSFDSYKKAIGYASIQIEKSLCSDLSDEQAARYVNLALEHIRDAYAIIRAEISGDMIAALPAETTAEQAAAHVKTVNLNKKNVRAWIATGNFARVKTDYRSGEREIEMKSWTVLRRMIESDIADILNGRPRLEKVNTNKATESMFARVQKNADKRAAAAAKAAEKAAAAPADKK